MFMNIFFCDLHYLSNNSTNYNIKTTKPNLTLPFRVYTLCQLISGIEVLGILFDKKGSNKNGRSIFND